MAPPAVEALMDPLARAYVDAWQVVKAEQARIANDPTVWRRQRRLREVETRIGNEMARLDERARALIRRDFPEVYRSGAMTVSQASSWTQVHREAVQEMAAATQERLLSASAHVTRTTRTLIGSISRDETLRALITGDTAQAAGRRVAQLVQEQGIHAVRYANGARHSLAEYGEMVVRTDTGNAYNRGVTNTCRQEDIKYLECFDGPDCGWRGHDDPEMALGRIVTVDEANKYPLAHPNCVPAGTAVHAVDVSAAYRSWYRGPLVRVRTSRGARLSVTPNHPVLTARGWIAAQELVQGDHVVGRAGERSTWRDAEDLDQVQLVEDVFESLCATGMMSHVVPATVDFHGDAAGFDQEVEVVDAIGGLGAYLEPAGLEQRRELQLVVAGPQGTSLAGHGSSSLGRLGVALPAARSVRRGHVAGVGTAVPELDLSLTETRSEHVVAHPGVTRELGRAVATEVAVDEIVEIGHVDSWSGHVYDLSTAPGLYLADGIIVHNCRRAFGARPDVVTAKDVTDAKGGQVTADQTAAQRRADRLAERHSGRLSMARQERLAARAGRVRG